VEKKKTVRSRTAASRVLSPHLSSLVELHISRVLLAWVASTSDAVAAGAALAMVLKDKFMQVLQADAPAVGDPASPYLHPGRPGARLEVPSVFLSAYRDTP